MGPWPRRAPRQRFNTIVGKIKIITTQVAGGTEPRDIARDKGAIPVV